MITFLLAHRVFREEAERIKNKTINTNLETVDLFLEYDQIFN